MKQVGSILKTPTIRYTTENLYIIFNTTFSSEYMNNNHERECNTVDRLLKIL